MPTTATHALPYPDDTDFVMDGSADVQQLAEAVDARLSRVLAHGEVTADSPFLNTGAWVDDALSVPFVPRADGSVVLDVRALTSINGGNSDLAARIGYHVTGPTEIVAADARSVLFAVLDNGGSQRMPMVSWRFLVTDLTPGGAYTAKLAAKGLGGWFLQARQLFVEAA